MKEQEKKSIFHSPWEPKMQNRFRMMFPKEFGIEPWMVQRSNLPIYNPWNRRKWEDIKVDFVDPIEPSCTEKLMKVASKGRKKFNISIEILDPTGVPVETWELKNCKVLKIDMGELNYNGDLHQPVLHFRPGTCVLNRHI